MSVPAVPADLTLSEIRERLYEPSLSLESFTDVCVRLGQMYAAVKRAEGEVKFAIGDAILAGEQLFGHRSYQAFEEFGLSEEVLGECARVSQRVPRSMRRLEDGLSWSHHRTVCSLELPERKAWLESAVTENLSVQALHDALRNGASPEPVAYCGECGRRL